MLLISPSMLLISDSDGRLFEGRNTSSTNVFETSKVFSLALNAEGAKKEWKNEHFEYRA